MSIRPTSPTLVESERNYGDMRPGSSTTRVLPALLDGSRGRSFAFSDILAARYSPARMQLYGCGQPSEFYARARDRMEATIHARPRVN
eukprot:scaffold55679_cov38-Tisochrysis_lutea.AAC.7